MFHIVTKQLKVLGSFRYGAGDYPLAISLVERGLVDLKPLVTHRYSFEEALTAFETTQNGKDANGKVGLSSLFAANDQADLSAGCHQVYHRWTEVRFLAVIGQVNCYLNHRTSCFRNLCIVAADSPLSPVHTIHK